MPYLRGSELLDRNHSVGFLPSLTYLADPYFFFFIVDIITDIPHILFAQEKLNREGAMSCPPLVVLKTACQDTKVMLKEV